MSDVTGPRLLRARQNFRQVHLCLLVLLAAAVAIAVVALRITEVGPATLVNPHPAGTYVYDGVPRGMPAWLGLTKFEAIFQGFGLIFSIGFFGWYGRVSWRDGRLHPCLLGLISMSVMAFFWEPLINRSMYLSFDPRMWHFPATTPWMRIAPNFEPWACFYGYPVYFVVPALLAFKTFQNMRQNAAPAAWVRRHPVLMLGLLGWVYGMVFDFALELALLRGGLYVYSQVWPAVSIDTGAYDQFPALLAVPTIALSMSYCAVLMYRDDNDRTVIDRLYARFAGHGASAWQTLLIACLLGGLSYSVYTAAFALVRYTGLATSIASPWPYQDQKTYDPDGLYRKAGAPGPFMDDDKAM